MRPNFDKYTDFSSGQILTNFGGLLRRGLFVALALALLLNSSLAPNQTAQAIERGPLNAALLATVQVIVPVAGEEGTYSTGSGTFMTDDGLILTNFHVMGDTDTGELYNANGFAGIAVNPTDLRSRPVLKYAAFLVGGDPKLDLALLRIQGLLDDPDAPLPQNLGIAPIAVGDSSALLIGDEINAFGFPSIGGDTVTFTSGKVAGFLDEDENGHSEWIKVDLNINRGNSGGLATNSQGEMIGVPTAGRSDLGMIGLVRDGNLAQEFMRRALFEGQTEAPPETGPYVRNVQFAPAIDPQGTPLDPTVQFEAGTSVIYATFDFARFSDGSSFTFVWYQGGFEVYRNSSVWSLGKEGNAWVNVFSKEGLEDGYYELELQLDGQQLFRDGVVVGAVANPGTGTDSTDSNQPDSTFGPITFAENVSEDNRPVNPGVNFSGISEVFAFFDVYNVPNGTRWSRHWYIDGELVAQKEAVWNGGGADFSWISLASQEPLPVGRYRLDLLIEDAVVQSAEMDVVAAEAEPPAISQVIVVGTVREADNRNRTVPGAAVYFLHEGITADVFLADPQDAQILAAGVTNEDGFYQLDTKLTPGSAYSVVVYKEGYRVVAVDGFVIDSNATSPHEVNVTMERR